MHSIVYAILSIIVDENLSVYQGLCLFKVCVHACIKVKSLCLTKHHAMKAYCGSGGIAPCVV